MNNSISVIIPFFKRQAVFDETIQSVFKQTLQPDEIIVVDDASGGIAIDFLKQYEPRITIIQLKKNVGVSEARNIGVKSAKSEYIAFLDSDDLWSTNKLEKQLDYMKNHESASLLHTGCTVFAENKKDITYNEKPLNLSFQDLVKNSHVMMQSSIIKRSVFITLGGFDKSFRQTEDFEFSMRLIVNNYQIHFLPELLTFVRHGTNDKLSTNWKGFLTGHVGVVRKYKHFYIKEIGLIGYYYCIVNYLEKSGYKQKGYLGKGFILSAKILKLFLSKPTQLN